MTLTYHGKTVSQARWVVEKYKNRTDLLSNGSVQQWLKDSQAVLDQEHIDPDNREWEYSPEGVKIYKPEVGKPTPTEYKK